MLPSEVTTEEAQALLAYCESLEACAYKSSYTRPPDPFMRHKSLREGIVFYSTGWGWRRRRGWRDVLSERFGI